VKITFEPNDIFAGAKFAFPNNNELMVVAANRDAWRYVFSGEPHDPRYSLVTMVPRPHLIVHNVSAEDLIKKLNEGSL